MGGVSTFFIKYGLIKEKICYYFAFFGGGSEKFSLKNFFREGDLGGVYTELLNFGGGLDGIGQKWGGSAFGGRRAPNWYTPPPGMFMTPSLNLKFHFLLTSSNIVK